MIGFWNKQLQDTGRTSVDSGSVKERETEINKRWDSFVKDLSLDKKLEIIDTISGEADKRKTKQEETRLKILGNIDNSKKIHSHITSLIKTSFGDSGVQGKTENSSTTSYWDQDTTFTTNVGNINYILTLNTTTNTKTFSDIRSVLGIKNDSTKYDQVSFHIPTYTNDGIMSWLLDSDISKSDPFSSQIINSLIKEWIPIISIFQNQKSWTHTMEAKFLINETRYGVKVNSEGKYGYSDRLFYVEKVPTETNFKVTYREEENQFNLIEIEAFIIKKYSWTGK